MQASILKVLFFVQGWSKSVNPFTLFLKTICSLILSLRDKAAITKVVKKKAFWRHDMNPKLLFKQESPWMDYPIFLYISRFGVQGCNQAGHICKPRFGFPRQSGTLVRDQEPLSDPFSRWSEFDYNWTAFRQSEQLNQNGHCLYGM